MVSALKESQVEELEKARKEEKRWRDLEVRDGRWWMYPLVCLGSSGEVDVTLGSMEA